MSFDWKRFDRRQWRFVAIFLATILVLGLVDRASLLIAPCGNGGGGYSDQKRANDDNCAIREGIVIAGVEWLSERSPETWTALATIAVAAFTLTLWLSSEKLWRVTRISTIATRRAANAARKSANVAEAALTVIERPYIFIWGIEGRVLNQQNAGFTYNVSNRGRLTAIIENVSIACGYESKGQYPPLRMIGDHSLLRNPLISSEKDVRDIPFIVPWSELNVGKLGSKFKNGLIFHVVISYKGPFTKLHETSQCWRYVSAINGFAEDGARTYAR